MKILFLHGWTSKPGGVKPTFLAQHGHTVINPALPDEDFKEAVRIALAEYDWHRPDVVAGSSRGGAVAMNLDSGDTPLVLLCPAWKKYGTARTVKENTIILHSRADDVVPFADSQELIRNSGLPATALVEVGNDHRLADPEPLAAMLKIKVALPMLAAGEKTERTSIPFPTDYLDWTRLLSLRDRDDGWPGQLEAVLAHGPTLGGRAVRVLPPNAWAYRETPEALAAFIPRESAGVFSNSKKPHGRP